MANLYQKLGDYNSIFKANFEQSFKYYEKALKIKKELYQGNHSYIALSLDKVGEIYRKSGDINKAIEFYKQAYLMYINNLGADHPISQNLKTYLEKISLEFIGSIES
ncbi:MAG TPA: tetratricopeptide repeat protein [Rickettsia endosymbiont of Omalisus fontisbellaquei]|nr:tetratricopeptide repeat protein [Rickettsia endosymbiont of Omalisus fontisbellaquei]